MSTSACFLYIEIYNLIYKYILNIYDFIKY